ncbi:response regulator [Sporosalibacterium faouarense]|uniref:response regulator n=1 Tax=Sporosalibacterium faouarense TaxID=516123 RepID=UPI001A9C34BF
MMGVLVVDDADFMRITIKGLLESNDIEVIGEASNGIEAVRKYKELSPKLVTMDITMPEMDGIGAVKEIIKIDPDAKIMVCSAMGQQSMVIEAIKAGAKTFVVKPFDQKKFINEVKSLL